MGPSPTYHPPEGGECETSVEHRLPLWAEPAVGYCSRRPRPSPMSGSRFVGARAVWPWLGEQKPLGKTPLRGNPSAEMTYLPTSCSPVFPLGVLCRMCGLLGHLAPVHWCARSVRYVACAVSWATWLLFTGVPAQCVVVRVRCPGALGPCSPVCPLGAFCRVCGVLGHLAPVQRCVPSMCCVVPAVSWATSLVFTGVLARRVVLRTRCPRPLGSCSAVCSFGAWCCVYGVLGHLAPAHRCASRCLALCVRCPGPLGPCAAVCTVGVLCCVFGVLGHLTPVHQCARSVGRVAYALSWATCLLFSGGLSRCVVLPVRCPGPLGSCSPGNSLGASCPVCGVLGLLPPVRRSAPSVGRVACAVSWATLLLFTGVSARCVVSRVRCLGPLGSCSPVCSPGALCCACGVLGHLASVHRCARAVRCGACAVFWANWLLFTCVSVRCVVSRVPCPGPLGSWAPVCQLGALCCVRADLGHLAPVHRCARAVRCGACAVSWATWLLFTGVLPRCVVLRVRCSWPLGSCSPVFPLGVLCRVCGVLGHLAPVYRCARSVRCVACAVSWAKWLLFSAVSAQCVVVPVRCPGPLGICSPVCLLSALCRVCGVLGHLAPVHRCVRSVCCVARAVSWVTWLLFTGVLARRVVLRTRYPGPLGSCSAVSSFGAWCCVYGVLGHLAPVHRCAPPVRCVVCAVSWATWLLFTGLQARRVVLRVRCPGPLCSCSLLCTLGALCFVCGVLDQLAPVYRCGRWVCCVACAPSCAT